MSAVLHICSGSYSEYNNYTCTLVYMYMYISIYIYNYNTVYIQYMYVQVHCIYMYSCMNDTPESVTHLQQPDMCWIIGVDKEALKVGLKHVLSGKMSMFR